MKRFVDVVTFHSLNWFGFNVSVDHKANQEIRLSGTLNSSQNNFRSFFSYNSIIGVDIHKSVCIKIEDFHIGFDLLSLMVEGGVQHRS